MDLADTDFKASIKSMFKELKETKSINFRESVVTMSCPMENINEKIQFKENQMEVLKWRSTITKMKNSLRRAQK